MITNLHIKNIGIIDDINIELDSGLNILSGETGAGKTLIIDSIGIICGNRFSKEMMRNGEKHSCVEACIYMPENENAIDGNIIVSREMYDNGRNLCKINGRLVTVNELKEFMKNIIDIHGQNDNQTLLDRTSHIAYLDSFIGKRIYELKTEYRELFEEYNKIKEELSNNYGDEKEKQRKLDLLRYQLKQIEEVSLKEGEDEELEAVYKKILHSKEIITSCQAASMLTGYEEEISIGNQLSESLRKMQEISHLDPVIQGFYEQLLSIEDLLNGFHQELTDYMEDMDFDEQTYQEAEERLNVINSLKDKYGSSIEEILAYGQKASERYNILCDVEHEIDILKQEQKQIKEQYIKEAENLSQKREKEAKKLERDITKALEDLNFLDVRFEIEMTRKNQISPDGIDQIRFMISTNPGLPMRPVQEVASGGELSRIMLALKSVSAQADGVDTLIFDEIDTGISGETANRVAKKMAVISKDHQVIAITHLPQIAAMADSHYFIRKQTDQKNTQTMIYKLNKEESLKEISRMISGDQRSEASMEHAKEMKTLADQTKLY